MHVRALPLLALPLLALLVLVAGLPAARAADSTTVYLPLLACPDCVGQPDPSFEVERMINMVNSARAAAGCPAAVPSDALMRAAQDWTDHMAATYDYQHAPSNWYTEPPYLYPSNGVWENIAAASTVADLAFNAWMRSTFHKRNIEMCYHPDDPSYSPDIRYEIGVGHAGGYWTLAIGIR